VWLLNWDEIPGYAIRSDQGIVGQPPWFNALGALLLVVGILVTRLLFARMRVATLREVLAVEAETEPALDIGETRQTGEAVALRPSAAAKTLSVAWWTLGWVAYCACALIAIVIGTWLASHLGITAVGGLVALVGVVSTTVALRRAGRIRTAVRIVAPILFVVIVAVNAMLALSDFGQEGRETPTPRPPLRATG
jgi:hypothetical protein